MADLNTSSFHKRLLSLKDGAYDVIYENKRYLLHKEIAYVIGLADAFR